MYFLKGPENENIVIKENQSIQPKNNKKETKDMKNANVDEHLRSTTLNKTGTSKKKSSNVNSNPKKYAINEKPTKQPRKYHYNQAYAVNMCMCGPQKPNRVLPNTNVNTDAKPLLRQSRSQEIVAQVASVKQTKPIDLNIPSQDNSDKSNKFTEENTCGSKCKCFQKMPSNTSLDLLLEKLTKWKYDLADPRAKLFNEVKSNVKSNNIVDINSKSILKNKSKYEPEESSSAKKHSVHDVNTGMPTETPVQCVEKVNKNEVLNFNLAVNTTSEYMGAINLDKSNEYVSTCVDTTESNNMNQQHESSKNILNECPIQSINLSECPNPPSNEEIEHSQSKDHTKVRVLNEHLYRKNKNTTDLNILTNSKSTKTVIPVDNDHKLKTKEIINQTDLVSSDQNKPEPYPNNFDYYIKFLGVTLADTDSHKIPKGSVKDGYKKSKNYLPSSQKYKENPDQKNEMPQLINNLKKEIKRDDNTLNSLSKTEKCECNAKFEEFQRFMINIFNDQSKKTNTQHKDIALDSPSLKCDGNHMENCACCNSFNADNSKELEVNAFHLLEDHLKQKLKEFKTCSCKSTCISPDEEEKIFSAILKRVKQVISDSANEAQSSQSGLITDASWKRAYGLLQEYLKIKIKRVQCSPLLNINKDVMVPNILEKVCDLIENDFKRLKDLCKCKKKDENLTKKGLIEHLLLPHDDVPEKDLNVPTKHKNNTLKVLSKQNSAKQIAFMENISSQVSSDFGKVVKFFDAMAEANCISTVSKQNSTDSIIVTQTMSSQVPPDLGLESKSCGALEITHRSEQTSEVKMAIFNKKSQGIIYNTCDCMNNTSKKPSMGTIKKTLRKKEVINYICTDVTKNTKIVASYPKLKNILKCKSLTGLGIVKPLPSLESTKYNKTCENTNKLAFNNTETVAKHPYMGCTINCSCDGHFKSCICSKSIVQNYSYKISDNWQQIVARSNNYMQDYSYIMKGSHNKNNDDSRRITTDSSSKIRSCIKHQSNENTCETEANESDVVLLLSAHTIDTSHQNTNTSPEITALSPDLCSEGSNSLDWFKYLQTIKSETKSSMSKFTDYQYSCEQIDESLKSCKSEITTGTETTKMSENCNCCKVPVCHVKMLVEEIERNILENKCTCDSASKICPVHSRILN